VEARSGPLPPARPGASCADRNTGTPRDTDRQRSQIQSDQRRSVDTGERALVIARAASTVIDKDVTALSASGGDRWTRSMSLFETIWNRRPPSG
jgi:hypothetical protein